MKVIKYLTAVVAATVVAAPAFAAGWTPETLNPATGQTSITLGSRTFTFDATNVQLEYFNANPGANSQAGIADTMKSAGLFGLTNNSVLNFGAMYDTPEHAPELSTYTINSTTYSTNFHAFDYLAVHVGHGELVFHWSAPITSFVLSTDKTMSNFRTYFSNTSPVPEPESYAMMIAGLGLVGFMARRRKQK